MKKKICILEVEMLRDNDTSLIFKKKKNRQKTICIAIHCLFIEVFLTKISTRFFLNWVNFKSNTEQTTEQYKRFLNSIIMVLNGCNLLKKILISSKTLHFIH